MGCSIKNKNEYQVTSIMFIKNFNKRDLAKELKSYLNEPIYFYIVRTVKYKEDKFVQTGTGPNLEGNLITLCTCKHIMRTYPEIKAGTWIAGFTSKNAFNVNEGPKGNYLFYLFKIEKALDNQYRYNIYLEKKYNRSYNVKNSVTNTFGDLFLINNEKEFKSEDDYYDPTFYESPHKKHGHYKNNKGESDWHGDIEKVNIKNWGMKREKEHKLLVGNKKKSYIWEKPVLKYNNFLTQGQIKSTIKDFLENLI